MQNAKEEASGARLTVWVLVGHKAEHQTSALQEALEAFGGVMQSAQQKDASASVINRCEPGRGGLLAETEVSRPEQQTDRYMDNSYVGSWMCTVFYETCYSSDRKSVV